MNKDNLKSNLKYTMIQWYDIYAGISYKYIFFYYHIFMHFI